MLNAAGLLLALAGPTLHVTQHPSAFSKWLESPLVKAPLPIPIFVLLAPLLWLLFRSTWMQLDKDALRVRAHNAASGAWDPRPAAVFVIVAIVLTTQEYYGGGRTYNSMVRPFLQAHDKVGMLAGFIDVRKYNELYSYGWWSFTRIFGYVFFPLPIWKLLFPKDKLLDMGFRTKGFLHHAWIYLACLAVVVPAMVLVAKQPDFGSYYPFYSRSSRSWADLAMWEAMYFGQFFALETFFRGWMLGALRGTMGSSAIFAMALPYCMIHFGKPYLEANGAVVAGIFLGSLSMKTKSIYAGFLVHITVALSMDLLALYNRGALPHQWFAP